MIRLSLLGPPGVGKGTYASTISEHFGIPHVSTGELLRQEAAKGSELGRVALEYMSAGLLVPDDVVNRVLFERLSRSDCARGFVLDGYPRTLAQARAIEEVFPLDAVVFLCAPLEVVVERVSGRLYCPSCGSVYHARWRPPLRSGFCDKCGGKLTRRRDDEPHVVEKRYREYVATAEPIAEFFRGRGKLIVFDASVDSEKGVPELIKLLDELASRKVAAVR